MDLTFNKYEDANRLLWSKTEAMLQKIHQGGGKKNIEKQHEKGKLTARERVDALLDPGAPRLEIGEFAGYRMYEEYGGCPG
ncbi:MAG TPA: acyl-CoA carboxylase subunit beta, partial [Chitinophagales bacterium]|nr:acyl-CoA carboxylase subunit beta [Chitinophagales bacterium]